MHAIIAAAALVAVLSSTQAESAPSVPCVPGDPNVVLDRLAADGMVPVFKGSAGPGDAFEVIEVRDKKGNTAMLFRSADGAACLIAMVDGMKPVKSNARFSKE